MSRENLGLAPGLVAAASLMVDYVMTVAVSTASGVAALTSAFPALYSYRVFICVAVVVLVALANLRGVRESGTIFAFPTYAFVLLCGGLVIVGMVRWLMGDLPPQVQHAPIEATQGLTIFLILRAFSGGCSAMTGTEAISNAVPAFKPPESRNAGITLGIMAAVLGFLAHRCDGALPDRPRGPRARRQRYGAEPGGTRGLRERDRLLLRPADRDHGHPLPGGQHQLRGLSRVSRRFWRAMG